MRKIILYSIVIFSVLLTTILFMQPKTSLLVSIIASIIATGITTSALIVVDYIRFSRTGESGLTDA